jgi:hypothetical protein
VSDLTAEDLDLLRAEGCLVDAASAAMTAYDDTALGSGRGLPAPSWDALRQSSRISSVRHASRILRAAGLEPGIPAEHLIRAACVRRGWSAATSPLPQGRELATIWATVGQTTRIVHEYADDAAIALALAFVAAVRAAQEQEHTS